MQPDESLATCPPLPPPFNTSPEPLTLIAQGAEARLYRTVFLTSATPAALKIRPRKAWRHPLLDRRLTRARILGEARVLVRLSGEGLVSTGGKVKMGGTGGLRGSVPAVLGVDWEAGWLALEWIEGESLKEGIRGWGVVGREEGVLRATLRRLGELVGRLHLAGVVHGDLTTSNVMLRRRRRRRPGEEEPSSVHRLDDTTATISAADNNEDDVEDPLCGELVLIDFGLATQSSSDEDRAVDLYVLERAFGSTHPREEGMFGEVLDGYSVGMGGKAGKAVLRRLDDVRLRGRKKSMIG